MSYNIRRMTLDDIPSVMEIEVEAFPHGGWQEHQYHYEITTNPVAMPFVLEVEGKIIGYYSFWQMFDYVTIATLAVSKDYRHQGYGNVLLQDIIAKALLLNMKSIDLEVRVSNEYAIKLYKSFGFKLSHIRKGYYSDGEDAYFMIKDLRSDDRA